MKKKIIKEKKKIIKKFVSLKKDIVLFFKEKDKLKKLKKLLLKINNVFIEKNVYRVLLMALPFIVMDVITRLWAYELDFFKFFSLTPRVFSLAYILLFIGLSVNIPKKYSKIVYIVCYIVFLIIFLVNGVYFSTTGNYFDMSMLELAGEGSSYFLDVLKSCNVWVYISMILLIALLIINIKMLPKNVNYNRKNIVIICTIFFLAFIYSRHSLGTANFELTWDTWRTPRNIYNNFNDTNKCMAICGLYEYSFRDFYVTYIKPKEKKSETESNFLMEVFNESKNSVSKNNYTGKYKDKNVIFLQLEGIDNWLLTNDIMPNTYSLLSNSINFSNHYSFYNGGGSTFNSEFAVNVGYMTPFTYPQNAYSLNKNDFPYSMANLLKNNNYSIKAFHMNSSEYYSRGINYQNWGYDRYFGLKDLETYKDNSYELDRELMLNETFYNEIFKSSERFVNYIITYSNHLPFTSSKGVCKQLLNLDYALQTKDMTSSEKDDFFASLQLTETDCIKRQAKETDNMVGLLIQALKDNNLYDKTIIVAYADHYLYTVSDENILKENGKDTSSNLINETPFFIWSKGSKKVTVTNVTSQLNILPTVLNLLGIEYNEKWYVASDALDNSYNGIAVFSDLSWYDGNVYVSDGIVTNNKKISDDELEEKNNLIGYLVKKNDLVLKYNYFKEITN